MKNLLYVFAILVVLASCSKDKTEVTNIPISGIIVDSVTKKPYANTRFFLYNSYPRAFFSFAIDMDTVPFITDEQGRFSTNFDFKNDYYVTICWPAYIYGDTGRGAIMKEDYQITGSSSLDAKGQRLKSVDFDTAYTHKYW